MTSSKPFVAVYLLPGFADWEASVLLPILTALDFEVCYVSDDGFELKSLGGLRVQPDLKVAGLAARVPDVLILVGSEAWLALPPSSPILDVARNLIQQSKSVAAICSATVGLARAGLLKGRAFTSNGQAFFRHFAPGADTSLYVEKLAARDGQLVTASGEGAIDFAREVLEMLSLMTEDRRKSWREKCAAGEVPTADLFLNS